MTDEATPEGRFSSLAIPEFRRLWWGGMFVFLAMQTQQIARSWLAYELTGTNTALGGVLIGFGVAGLIAIPTGGVLADRFKKRTILVTTQLVNTVTAMLIAVAMMIYLLVLGPTSYLMNGIVSGFGRYVFHVLPAGFATAEFFGDDLVNWFQDWTLNYMIWWLAWSPFVGIFIARISRGRTIREFLIGVIVAPTLFSILWFGIFGGLGLFDTLRQDGALSSINAENLDATTFALLERFPLDGITRTATVLAAFLFVVTSVVSAGFTLAMIGTGGDENPSPRAV